MLKEKFFLILQQVRIFFQDSYSRKKKKFKGSCLKQEDQAAFTAKNVVNFFIVCELDSWLRDLNTDFT